MSKKIFAYLAGAILLITCLLFSAGAQEKENPARESEHIQRGMDYYNSGFYEFAPKRQQEKASKNYQLAVDEFKKAIAINPASEEAHRNLARVFYVQKEFEQASEEYRKLTELNPHDIDAHVLLALTLTRMNKLEEAIAQLEKAKTWTSEQETLKKLDEYIQKVEANR